MASPTHKNNAEQSFALHISPPIYLDTAVADLKHLEINIQLDSTSRTTCSRFWRTKEIPKGTIPDVYVVSPRSTISTAQALELMSQNGFKPATLPFLVALLGDFHAMRNYQRIVNCPLVILGTNDKSYCPVLLDSNGTLEIREGFLKGAGWTARHNFLAIKAPSQSSAHDLNVLSFENRDSLAGQLEK